MMRQTSLSVVVLLMVLFGVIGGIFAVLLGFELAVGGAAALLGILATQGGTLINTAVFGTATALLATALAWLLAHIHHCYRFRGRAMLHWLCLTPLLMPSFTVAMALVIVFGNNGFLARASGVSSDIYGLGGLIIAGTLARLPYSYIIILVSYRSIEPELFDAADSLGASGWRRLTVVLWPRIRLVLLSVLLLVFADTVADLANPLVVGGNFHVLASRLFEAVNGEGDLATASGYGVLLLIPAVIFWIAARRIGVERPAGMLSRASAGLCREPSRPGRVGIAVGWAVGMLIAVLLAAVAIAAFFPPSGGIAARPLTELLTVPGNRALASSLMLAVIVVPISVVLATVGLLAAASRPVWLDRLERWCGAAAAVPSVLLGFCAYLALVTWQGTPGVPAGWTTSGVVGLLITVLLLRNAPAAALAMVGRVRTMVPEAREAAVTLGVGGRRLLRLVYLPRLRGPIRDVVVLTTARTLTATSSVILLSDVRVPLLTSRMLIDTDAGRVAAAAAATVVIGAVIGLVAMVARWGWGRE